MKLEYDVKTVNYTDYHAVEDIITKVYDREYEIPCGEECGSSDGKCMLEYHLKKQPLSDYDSRDLIEFKRGNKNQWMLSILLQDMCNNDIVPEGNLFIDVNW